MSLRRPPLTVLYREEEHHLITPKWGMKARFLIQPLLTQVREIPHHSWMGWELSLLPHPQPRLSGEKQNSRLYVASTITTGNVCGGAGGL